MDLAHLKTLLSDNVAGLMLTNPNTLGLFEDDIAEICDLIHEAGGLVYCDGANMNALVGRARPGDMGFDVMHFNLHKTFSSPHGGGGPGSGPVGRQERSWSRTCPCRRSSRRPTAIGWTYDRPKSVGKIHGYYGSFLCILRAYVYILYYGRERLAQIAENAVLNANYIRVRLQDDFDVAYNEICMHECVFTASASSSANTASSALDIAKRLDGLRLPPADDLLPADRPRSADDRADGDGKPETLDDFIAACADRAGRRRGPGDRQIRAA